MNPILFGIIVIAFQFFTAVALLYLAGGLIELGLHRRVSSGSRHGKGSPRLIRDLRGLEDAVVEFFARSNESSSVLSVLVTHKEPLKLTAITRKARLAEDRHHGTYSPSATVALGVLSILLLAGLVRMTRRGFLITEVGREVYKRIKVFPATSVEDRPTREGKRRPKIGETLHMRASDR